VGNDKSVHQHRDAGVGDGLKAIAVCVLRFFFFTHVSLFLFPLRPCLRFISANFFGFPLSWWESIFEPFQLFA
jgi:hypothetical protein